MIISNPNSMLQKVKDAYSRFKTYVYYDNSNLHIRTQIAEYEKGNDLETKLAQLSDDLSKYLRGEGLSSRISQIINDASFTTLPKTLEDFSKSQIKSILISNELKENINVKKTTILFSGQIELHIISTLWVTEQGIKLNKHIGPDSYGYHLSIHPETGGIGSKKMLFSKYFEKYQEWRDKGLKAAKNQINDGNDVLMLSLDIKEFFHSSTINFKDLKKDLGGDSKNSLTDLIQLIFKQHTSKLYPQKNNELPILPIGLTASGVIANWYLSEFDRKMKDVASPVYYGRYVDDIFIVVSNVKPPKPLLTEESSPQENDQSNENIESVIKWLVSRFFSNNEPLTKTEDNKALKFSNKEKYPDLQIQGEKLKIFYFSPDWPLAMLNKFQKALQENSSAFWFLPDEEELKDSLDDKAYDMQYEDTINKFRSVSDVKTSKYGAAIFLAKRIKLAILHSESDDKKITSEIFRFFKGPSIIILFNMWERIFTYLVVKNDIKSIKKIITKIYAAINSLTAKENQDKIKQDLTTHLSGALCMAISLNPSIAKSLNTDTIDINQLNEGIYNLRRSLLTRHHYLPFPSLVMTNHYTNTMESLLSNGLFNVLVNSKNPLMNEDFLQSTYRIPRRFHLQEICILTIIQELKAWKKDKNPAPLFFKVQEVERGQELSDSYILESCSLFSKINGESINENIICKSFKTYSSYKSQLPIIQTNTIDLIDGESSLKIKLGLSNMRIQENDLKAAISERSIISTEKRAKHIKLLNAAEHEKVDLLILPETTVPIDWLYAYADESRRKKRAFIFGLEHFQIDNYCFNLSIALLPIQIGKRTETLIVPRLKNHYSPKEESEIKKLGKKIPSSTTSTYQLFTWKGIQFTLYNCYELADVVHRSIFRSELDILFAIEYNKDVNYFSNIAESTCRDLHCYFVQANTSDFGDSRVIEPKETEKMNPVRVKGGENNVILKYEIDVQKLRNFQIQRLPYQTEDKSFKTTPPDYDHTNVSKRGKGH